MCSLFLSSSMPNIKRIWRWKIFKRKRISYRWKVQISSICRQITWIDKQFFVMYALTKQYVEESQKKCSKTWDLKRLRATFPFKWNFERIQLFYVTAKELKKKSTCYIHVVVIIVVVRMSSIRKLTRNKRCMMNWRRI